MGDRQCSAQAGREASDQVAGRDQRRAGSHMLPHAVLSREHAELAKSQANTMWEGTEPAAGIIVPILV